MATANRALLLDMKSKLSGMGGVVQSLIGEPKMGIQDGIVAIIPQGGRIDETTLTAPREIHTVIFRRYADMLREPTENIEFELDQWRAEIMSDVFGDFDLGGNAAYCLPDEFQWTYGYQTIEQRVFRLLDITVAYRIDDNATFAA